MEVIIKPFRVEYQDKCCEIIEDGLKEHWGILDKSLNPDIYDIETNYKNHIFLTAWLGENLIGTGAALIEYNVAQIVRMYVKKSYRSKGVGEKLLEALEMELNYLGITKIILETTTNWKKVVKFYLRNGFTIIKTENDDTYFQKEINMSHGNKTSYEPFAEIYLESTDKKPYTTHYERPFIISRLPELADKSVLDLGCATGFYSKYCIDNGAKVTAIDASRKMIDYTNKVCKGRVKTYVHDIAKPFTFLESSSMDLIICSLVIHYIENWENTLNELHRILRPGGRCIISCHHPVNDYEIFNKENYFNKRLVEDVWKGFEKPLKVTYFVRPLSEYLQPILNSKLTLKEVVEPEPSEELKQINNKVYERLSNRPGFLFFILEKND